MTTQHVDSKNLSFAGPLSDCLKRLSNGSLSPEKFAANLQDLLEDKKDGGSSLSQKVVDEFEGVNITEAFLSQTMTLHGQELKRHRNGGGWVPAKQDRLDERLPYVAETAYVGPFAKVYGNAKVYGDAKVSGNDSVSGDAKISGDASVSGDDWLWQGVGLWRC